MKTVNRKRFVGRLGAIFIALTCLFTIAATTANAQGGISPAKFDLGLKVGLNFSNLSGSQWENGFKTNLVGGAYAGVRLVKIGFQAEALFSQSGYTTGKDFHDLYSGYYNNLSDSLKQGTFRVNKLTIPLLVQFKLLPGLWLQAGAQYSGIVSVTDKDDLVKDAKAMFKTSNIAGIAGFTFHLNKLNVGARYIFDFSDMNNTNLGDVWKQHVVQIHIGYKLL